jgi:fructose 1,6-bisphosphatase
LAVVTALLLAGVLVFGFATGLAKEKKSTSRTVSGLVLDETENGIEGATIELTDVQTGKVVAIYSQEGGQYHLSDLLPSHDYKIKATFKGASSEIRQVSSMDTRPHPVINLTLSGLKH